MILLTAKTKKGIIEGLPASDHETAVYKGIPYAAPPVGNLRWRAPQPVEVWEGIKKAYTYKAIPVQMMSDEEYINFGGGLWPMSEDCLYLNIWTPAQDASEKLPVVLWVYGGSYKTGSSTNRLVDGEAFAKRGCIFVSFNYREGILGYFAHPALAAESEHHVSGNYGTLDQIAALKWVYENIDAFGGDPGRITLLGQSAGAHSVMTLCNTPLTDGLVQRAIIHSTAGLSAMYYQEEQSLANAQAEGERLFDSCGIGSIEEARQIDAVELVEKFNNVKYGSKMAWFPKTDNYVLPLGTISSIMAGCHAKISYLCGSTSDESGSMPPFISSDSRRIPEFARQMFEKDVEGYLKSVDCSDEDKVRKCIFDQYKNDKLCALLGWQELEIQRGGENFYEYYYTKPQPGEDNQGACHSCELPYVFQTFSKDVRPYDGSDFELSEKMCSYWVNFVKTGNPNGEGLPIWEKYSASNRRLLELGDNIKMTDVPWDENRKFIVDYMLKQAKDIMGKYTL